MRFSQSHHPASCAGLFAMTLGTVGTLPISFPVVAGAGSSSAMALIRPRVHRAL